MAPNTPDSVFPKRRVNTDAVFLCRRLSFPRLLFRRISRLLLFRRILSRRLSARRLFFAVLYFGRSAPCTNFFSAGTVRLSHALIISAGTDRAWPCTNCCTAPQCFRASFVSQETTTPGPNVFSALFLKHDYCIPCSCTSSFHPPSHVPEYIKSYRPALPAAMQLSGFIRRNAYGKNRQRAR